MLIDDRQIQSVHKNKITDLSTVGKTNNYSDLNNKPTEYKPSPHVHPKASASKSGFLSKENKDKIDNLKNYNKVQVNNSADTDEIKPSSVNSSLTIEAGQGVRLNTNTVNGVLTISAVLEEIDNVIKGETGDKGESGDTFRPQLNIENEIEWTVNKNETPPESFNILGDKGPTGEKGPVGNKGMVGEKGPQGDKGPQGLQGIVGDKGPVGEKGDKGPQGFTGDTGDKGPTGDKGIKGDKGPQGIPGEAGPSGPAGNWNNIYKPSGREGQIYYIGESNDNIVPDFSLITGRFVETDKELAEAKANPVNFEEIFNTWKRFSHDKTTNQPANESEMNSWKYNSTLNRIESTINSNTHIGFVSLDKYEKYTHEVTLKSSNTDDDSIGVIIAFMTDENGIEHTLTAVRSRSSRPTWFIVYDYAKSTSSIINRVSINIEGDDVDGSTNNVPETGWNRVTEGTKIKIERNGDIIKAYASPYNQTTYSTTAIFEVDLNTNPLLTKFKGPQSYGYSCYSQSLSTFENIYFSADSGNAIYDLARNEVWTYLNKAWTKDSTRSLYSDVGIGKLLYNPETNKLFFTKNETEVLPINFK